MSGFFAIPCVHFSLDFTRALQWEVNVDYIMCTGMSFWGRFGQTFRRPYAGFRRRLFSSDTIDTGFMRGVLSIPKNFPFTFGVIFTAVKTGAADVLVCQTSYNCDWTKHLSCVHGVPFVP